MYIFFCKGHLRTLTNYTLDGYFSLPVFLNGTHENILYNLQRTLDRLKICVSSIVQYQNLFYEEFAELFWAISYDLDVSVFSTASNNISKCLIVFNVHIHQRIHILSTCKLCCLIRQRSFIQPHLRCTDESKCVLVEQHIIRLYQTFWSHWIYPLPL